MEKGSSIVARAISAGHLFTPEGEPLGLLNYAIANRDRLNMGRWVRVGHKPAYQLYVFRDPHAHKVQHVMSW